MYYDLIKNSEEIIKDELKHVDDIVFLNSKKVLDAFKNENEEIIT